MGIPYRPKYQKFLTNNVYILNNQALSTPYMKNGAPMQHGQQVHAVVCIFSIPVVYKSNDYHFVYLMKYYDSLLSL